MAALAGRYLEEHVAVRCKPRTSAMCRMVVEKYILPEFGQRSALAVGQAQVAELHYKLHGYCHIKCGLETVDRWRPENPCITATGFHRTSSATQYDCTIVSA